MTTKDLQIVLDRFDSWPPEAQEEALQSLAAIKEEYVVDPALMREIEEAREQIRQGLFVSHEELMAEHGL